MGDLARVGQGGEGGFGLPGAGFGGLELGPLLVESFLCGVREVGFELALDEVGFGLRGRASLVGELLHALVDGEVQERHQDLAALLGLALQEGVELALREDDRAREAVVVEAEDAVDLRPDLLDAVGEGLGRVRGDPLEALLGGLVGAGGARDAVALLPDSELEQDREALGAVADELLVVVADAGDLAVEGEADRVDQGRLAGAGRAGDGEQVEAREVELELVAEGGEAFERELVRPHFAASSWSCVEELLELLRRRGLVAVLVVGGEELGGGELAAALAALGLGAGVAGVVHGHVEGVREQLLDAVGEAGRGGFGLHPDAQVVVASLVCEALQVGERALDRAQPSSRGDRDELDAGRPLGLRVEDDDALVLLLLAEVELDQRAGVARLRGGQDLLRAVEVAEGDVLDASTGAAGG